MDQQKGFAQALAPKDKISVTWSKGGVRATWTGLVDAKPTADSAIVKYNEGDPEGHEFPPTDPQIIVHDLSVVRAVRRSMGEVEATRRVAPLNVFSIETWRDYVGSPKTLILLETALKAQFQCTDGSEPHDESRGSQDAAEVTQSEDPWHQRRFIVDVIMAWTLMFSNRKDEMLVPPNNAVPISCLSRLDAMMSANMGAYLAYAERSNDPTSFLEARRVAAAASREKGEAEREASQ